jgi:hypothetical protein
MDLPSGMLIVDDEKIGVRIRTEFYELFDRSQMLPVGSRLSDDEVLLKARSDGEHFRLYYQELSSPSGAESSLKLIERIVGAIVAETIELVGDQIRRQVLV